MVIPSNINALFSDSNGDSVKVKINTKPFITGSIDDIVNWMVANQIATVDMEDTKTGVTPFFLACRHNPNDDLFKWLIQTQETNLSFKNKKNLNVIEYLIRSEFNSPTLSHRIKYILNNKKFDYMAKNNLGDTLFDQFCYSGYLDIVSILVTHGAIYLSPDKIEIIIKKINKIIAGECTDYYPIENVNEQHFIKSLENIVQYLTVVLENINSK